MKIESPQCFADVLCVIVAAQKRLTRSSIVQALEEAGKRWSDGSVGKALAQLTAIEAIDNRQDVSPKGYAVFGSDSDD